MQAVPGGEVSHCPGIQNMRSQGTKAWDYKSKRLQKYSGGRAFYSRRAFAIRTFQKNFEPILAIFNNVMCFH